MTFDVEARLAAIAGAKVPGIQYVVVKAAGVTFEFAGGWADIRRTARVESDTTMMAYSMSKTITAVAVLQLVEAGRIDLDEPLQAFVESQPYGSNVTVRQLLSHSSGIPNPIPLRWVHPMALHETFDEASALAQVLRTHPRLSFEPGAKYAYSNIGYWLLGNVVERASGEPFCSYVDRHILRPLGVSPNGLGYVVVDPARHATGYLEKYSLINLVKGFLVDSDLIGEYAGPWLEIRGHYPNGPAFGGLVGSARGFGAFLQDQLRERSKVLGEEGRRFLYAPQPTRQQGRAVMTLGWHIGTLGSDTFYYKEGGGGGFHCMMRVYRDRGVGTVVMTNATGFDVGRLLNTFDPVFLSLP